MTTVNLVLPYLMAAVSLSILLVDRIRVAIGLLAVQYVFAFVISLSFQPIRSVSARLIGGIVVFMLLMTAERRFSQGDTFIQTAVLPRSLWFRIVTSFIVVLVAWAFATQAESIAPSVDENIFLGAVFYICLGMLMIGLYQTPLEAGIGLFTLLTGFDLFYGGIEPSLAIVALMISIQLIIALAISYIMSIAHNAAELGEEQQ
jgi:hypothetical protein